MTVMVRDDPLTHALMDDGQLYVTGVIGSAPADGLPLFREPRYVADPYVEFWRREYERGAVRGFVVVEAQGEPPRVDWIV